jgi:N-acetylglucosamine transport system permease protein
MKIISRILGGLGLAAFFAIVIVPMLWTVMSSFKTVAQIATDPWGLPNDGLKVENYSKAWTVSGIGDYFVNSLIVCAGTMAVLLPVAAMASYVIARYKFWGRGALFGGFMGGMMVPQFLFIVPLYVLLTRIQMGTGVRLLDSHLGLVLVYIAFSLPFTVFVLTGFFQGLPEELAEAARLDGCGHAGVFWRIMLPLASPGLVVAGIFNVIGLWNEYNLALVLISSKENFTLPLGLANLTNTLQYTSDWGALFAAVVIVMGPVLAVYWLLKEKIHEAMLAGAVKG